MDKISKINFKVLNKITELGNSRLEFKLAGPNIDYIVVNTIRRTILSEIPIYAFNDFKFEKNTSVFHNNYLKLRLRQLPVWSIENTVDFLDNKLKKSNENDEEINENIDEIVPSEQNQTTGDEIQLQVDKSLNSSSLKQLTMYINYKNKSNEIVNVTTSDAKFYYEEKQIASPYKIPIPLVKLQPGQEIAFSAITNIGTEFMDAMFSAVSACVYKQIDENEFDFVIESRGQISEKRILQVALINIEKRMKNLLKMLSDEKKSNNSKDTYAPHNDYKIKKETTNDGLDGVIIVNNEDHTMGNLISRGMQKHDKISFAGYNLPHPLGRKVHFHYKLRSGEIKNVVKDVIDYYTELFEQIEKHISSI